MAGVISYVVFQQGEEMMNQGIASFMRGLVSDRMSGRMLGRDRMFGRMLGGLYRLCMKIGCYERIILDR